MCKRWLLCIGLLFLFILLGACSSDSEAIKAEDIPVEESQQGIKRTIEFAADKNFEIDEAIEAAFPLITTVEGNSNHAEIYATTRFTLPELSSLLTTSFRMEEVSSVEDNQQIIIYPDHFVTLRESDVDEEVLFIEVAGDEFVRENYSPNFLSTYFSIRILESMLGNNWDRNYSGDAYRGMGSLGGSTDSPNRGRTTFRGGGPGSGK